MNKFISAVIVATALTLPALAQSVTATDVNYGNGNIVKETSGNGAPSDSCSNLTRYTQKDATAGQNIWQCVNGHMVQQVTAEVVMPQKSSLTFQYLLNEGTGAVANDSSGAGANGAIVGATWDGATDLSFSGSSQYVSIPTSASIATKTFLIAAYFNTLASSGGAFATNPSLLCGTASPMRCFIENSLFKAKSQRFYDYKGDHTESTDYVTPGWHIIGLSCGSGPSHIYVDGAEVGGYVVQGSNGCGNVVSGNYQIGGSAYATGSWWFGKVAATWGWSTQLSAADISTASNNAMSYIVSKGAVLNVSPVPIYTPQVIGSIDSRTYGVGIVTPANKWMLAMNLTDATYARTNLAVSGATIADACAMFGSMYKPYINPANGPTIMVVWGGVNDFGGSMTARLIANNLRCVVQKAKAAGARVIVATEISAYNGFDTMKNSLDPIIRQEAFSWGADNIADLATEPILGADNAYSDATYFLGGLHPNDAGEVYVTTVMQDAVNELIGSNATNHFSTAAATYQELAGDRFIDLTGTAAQTITLPSCLGYSLPRSIFNLGTTAGTVAPNGSETLKGSTALAVGSTAVFLPVPGATSTGGCSWSRIQ